MSGWRKRQIADKIMEDTMEEYFVFLDSVRESGQINMLGATPYLQEMFDLDRHQAREVLLKWIDTFTQRHPQGK